MKISTGEKLIFLAVSSRSYTHKTFGQGLVPRAAIIELSLLTICGWRLELTFNFYSCDNLWFIEAWIRQWDRCYHLNLFLLSPNLQYISYWLNKWNIFRYVIPLKNNTNLRWRLITRCINTSEKYFIIQHFFQRTLDMLEFGFRSNKSVSLYMSIILNRTFDRKHHKKDLFKKTFIVFKDLATYQKLIFLTYPIRQIPQIPTQ